jgi:microcystin-dependent protein
MSTLDFKIQNSATTQVGNDLNYNQLPEYQRHVALQIGDLKLSLGGEINGWLLCNGQSLSIAEYTDLYNVIGTNFGSTGAGYFNVPDFTSRVIGMFGPSEAYSELTIRTMGEAVGTETETLTTDQIPSHYHIGTTDGSGAHTHTSNATGGPGTSGDPATGLAYSNSLGTTISTDITNGEVNTKITPIALTIDPEPNHTHTFTTQNTGGGGAHNNIQPTLFGTRVLIFAKWIRKVYMEPISYNYD